MKGQRMAVWEGKEMTLSAAILLSPLSKNAANRRYNIEMTKHGDWDKIDWSTFWIKLTPSEQ